MKDNYKKDADYIEEVVNLRGFIINKAIKIEGSIDTILSYYFMKNNPSKNKEFHDKIITVLNNSQKTKIFISVLKSIEKEYSISYSERLPRLLNNIIDIRNKVAHYKWTAVFDNGTIYLNKGNSKTSTFVSDAEIETFIKDCKSATSITTRILRDIGYLNEMSSQYKNNNK